MHRTIDGQKYIAARTEFDKAQFVTHFYAVTHLRIRCDPPCHDPSDLSYKYRALVGGFDHHRIALIEFRGFRMERHQILARMILAIDHFPTDGYAVEMDIQRRHINRDFEAL